MEISRKTLAEPIGIFVAGTVRGFKEAAPVLLGMSMTALSWTSGHKKTAAAYAALTVGCVARMVHGADADTEADLAFGEAIADTIRGEDAKKGEA